MPRPNPYTAEQVKAVVAGYRDGLSTHELVQRHGGNRKTIRRLLLAGGIEMRTQEARQHRLPCRHDAFADAVGSEAAAYWVGLLMADGCVSHGRHSRYVILGLGAGDADHVERFREFLGAGQRLRKTRGGGFGPSRGVQLAVASRRLVEDLARYGVVPRKTRTARVVGLEMNRHFWRGVIDGDGSIHLGVRAGGRLKPRPVLQLTGSQDLVSQFADYASAVAGAAARPHRSRGAWALSVSCSPATRLLNHLYGDCSVSLPRKLEAARQAIKSHLRSPPPAVSPSASRGRG